MFCYCYDDKQIIAAVYSFDYCSLITVLFHMIFKIKISQDFDDTSSSTYNNVIHYTLSIL